MPEALYADIADEAYRRHTPINKEILRRLIPQRSRRRRPKPDNMDGEVDWMNPDHSWFTHPG